MKLKIYEVEVEYELNYETYEEKDTNYIEHTFVNGYLTGYEVVKEKDYALKNKLVFALKGLDLEVYLLKRMTDLADNDYLTDNYSEVIELIGYKDKDGLYMVYGELL